MTAISIFLSSPSDVRFEREEARRIIEQLSREFAGRATIGGYFWESQPLEAAKAPQVSIREASSCDIVVGIVWSRMGTPLDSARYCRPDGSAYESGTAYELESALAASRSAGAPRVLLYRNSRPVTYPAEPPEAYEEASDQYKRLKAFIERHIRGADGVWKGAYKDYGNIEQFGELLDDDLTQLLNQAVVEGDPISLVPSWTESPFRGLEPFDLQHDAIFFGRTGAINAILEQLNRQRASARPFILVLGMSGSGKSSLVRAGVLPRLFRARAVGDIEVWRHAIFKPRDGAGDPVAALAQALLAPTALPWLVDGEVTAARLRENLDETVGALRQSLLQDGERERERQAKTIDAHIDHLVADRRTVEADELRAKLPGLRTPKVGFALVIDQMEELFDEQVTSAQRSEFMHIVDRLVRRGVVHVLATLRSDFFARCHELPGLEELKTGDGQFDLPWPGATEIGQMIRLPARLAALRFEPHPDSGQLLDERLRDDATEFPQSLPLLEFVLDALYERRTAERLLTHAAYEEMGGLKGAINRRAASVWDGLSPAARKSSGAVFGALVQISESSEGRVQRKYAPASAWENDPHRRELVEAFVQARLFIAAGEDGGSRVSLAHETLIEHFEPLKQWVDDHRDQLHARSRLAAQAALWDGRGRDAGDLFRGRPLGEARALQADGWLDLTATENDFIAASRGARRRWRLFGGGAAVIAIVTVVVVGKLSLDRWEAKQIARAQSLVGEADAERARAPQVSVSKARDAAALRPAIGAPALRRALAADRQLRWSAQLEGVRAVAFGTQKPLLVVGTWNGAFIRDMSRDDSSIALDPEDKVESVALSPDDTLVLTAGARGVRLWRDRVEILHLPAEKVPVTSAAFAPDGRRIAYLDGGRLRLWTSNGTWTGDSLAERREETNGDLLRLALTPDGKPVVTDDVTAVSAGGAFVAIGNDDGTARVTQRTGDVVAILNGHQRPVTNVKYSPGGRFIATASDDRTVAVWEPRTSSLVARLVGHTSAVHALAFNADGSLLATGADDGVRLWALDGALHPMTHGRSVNAATFDASGQFLLTASSEGLVRVWHVASGELIGVLRSRPPRQPVIRVVAVDRQGRWVVAGQEGGKVDIWDARTCELITEFAAHPKHVNFVAFGRDGTLLTAGADGSLRRWTAGEWKEDPQRLDHGGPITAAALSPGDDAVIATAGTSGTVRLWDLRSGAAPRALVGVEGRVHDIAFSDDGHLVVAAAADGGTHIWEVATGRAWQTLQHAPPSSPVRTAQFRPGASRQVVTADEDGTVRIWDGASASPVTQLPSHSGAVTRAAFRPDGLALVTVSTDHTARVHPWFDFVPVDELLERSQHPLAVPAPRTAELFACPTPTQGDLGWPAAAQRRPTPGL